MLPVTLTLATLMADAGRMSGLGDGARLMLPPKADELLPPPAPPLAMVGERVSEEGCWRTEKTKVLFAARRAHCGCATYRS